MTCTNASATQPFGAIDTPTPGETVGGGAYTSFGWVLARGPRRADVPGGGTVTVVIDGVAVGSPAGWSARSDLSSLFPAGQYPGINNALGVFAFDTRTLSNGMHTMAWVVVDNQGGAAGVGSRYFRVFNQTGSSMTLAPAAPVAGDPDARNRARGCGAGTMRPSRRGAAMRPIRRCAATTRITTAGSRCRPRSSTASSSRQTAPRPATCSRARRCVRSRSDRVSIPPPARSCGSRASASSAATISRSCASSGGRIVRQDVRIVLNPKGSNRVGPQLVVDLAPGPREDASGGIVAGWAADLDSPDGTGIQMIHAWAYPRGGGAPLFVGDASYGGARPDVAEVFGERFRDSGYGLRVQGLPPGDYDLALFAWSTARHAWLPAKVVADRRSNRDRRRVSTRPTCDSDEPRKVRTFELLRELRSVRVGPSDRIRLP